MADESKSIRIVKPIPAQVVNIGATYGPLKLNEFIQPVEGKGGNLRFQAELKDGAPLPKGLICSTDGIVNGIPAKETEGLHHVIINVTNDEMEQLAVEFELTIKPRLTMDESQIFRKLKTEVWEALGKNLPLPEMVDLLNRPITAVEIYYLLQRFATLTIWDVYNLDYPSDKKLITLEGISHHYQVYDRGCCIVGAPKDLFSHERTLEDALQTARAMAREVYKRGWAIEFAGFNKMVRAAWVELQHLGDSQGKSLEIFHYTPSAEDVKVYVNQSKTKGSMPNF